MSELKIDVYPHILPGPYFEKMVEVTPNKMAVKRWTSIPLLVDLNERMRVMDQFPGYKQILTLSLPAVETLAGPEQSPELARIANDSLAEICRKHPDYFPGWVAAVPMNNVPAAIVEIERAIEKLGARGIQIFTSVNGRPLDDPEFFPIFERMAAYDMPIWMHPWRPNTQADYKDEPTSKFEIWWAFGWPYETSVAMARMVFSRFFERLPNLKIITHHMGAMIPYFEGRVGPGWDELGNRTGGPEGESLVKLRHELGKRPIDYFKMFYADTAVSASASAIRCGYDFFGPDRSLFGTDCPFDPEGGTMWIRDTIAAIDKLAFPEDVRKKLYAQNAIDLCRLQGLYA
jgi:predicted TIM-barrel fold metal-dependent hydrolase